MDPAGQGIQTACPDHGDDAQNGQADLFHMLGQLDGSLTAKLHHTGKIKLPAPKNMENRVKPTNSCCFRLSCCIG